MPCRYSGKLQLLRLRLRSMISGFADELTDITFDGAEVSAKDYGMIGVAVGDFIGGTLGNVVVRNSSVIGSNAGTPVGWDASDSMVNCSVENVTVNGQPCEKQAYHSCGDSVICPSVCCFRAGVYGRPEYFEGDMRNGLFGLYVR